MKSAMMMVVAIVSVAGKVGWNLSLRWIGIGIVMLSVIGSVIVIRCWMWSVMVIVFCW